MSLLSSVLTAAPGATPYLYNPCRNASSAQSKLPWCDETLPIESRVADMLGRMSLKEKIGALDTETPAIPSLELLPYNWWSEATHGISHVRNDATTPYETNFAFPITTAMAFNRTLWKATGAAIGREARAFMNAGNAWSTYWAPVINLAREPRWGRNIETPGEDPYLSGEYATAFVTGFQESPDDPRLVQASACCKHYVANSMDDSTVAGVHHTRYSMDANISMQDLVDSYMLPFQACVEKGRVTSLMCSYNAVNGVPSCANDWLLTTVAREAWHFDGYVTSDCDADANVYNPHHYTTTPEETVRAVLRAGTDVDCTSFVGQHAAAALNQSLITEADIDARLRMLFRVRVRLGHFDPPGPLDKIAPSEVCTPATVALARAGVAQGAALFKNVGGALPLKKGLRKVAVLGPNANLSKAVAGYYGGNNCAGKYETLVEAVAAHAVEVVSAAGVPSVTSDDTSGVGAAAALARDADATVLVLGTDLGVAMEGRDAVNITLSAGQLALVAAAAAASPSPVVVVTVTATPLDLSPLLSHPKVGAVLHAGMPSVQTAGVADVLFGDVSPAGRAVQTVYPASYQHQISIFDFNMRPGPSAYARPDCNATRATEPQCPRGTNPGRTHRFFTGTPVVPFGFGLSYSTFSLVAHLDGARRAAPPPSRTRAGAHFGAASFPPLVGAPLVGGYEVRVTNTGAVDADDVVLGFIAPPGAGEGGVPRQSLFGFERVHVPAGQTVSVWLYPALTELAHTTLSGERVARPGTYTVWFGSKESAAAGMGFASTELTAHLAHLPGGVA